MVISVEIAIRLYGAPDIERETSQPEKSAHNVKITKSSIIQNVSSTFLSLLSYLKVPEMLSSLVDSAITSYILKSSTPLQLQ